MEQQAKGGTSASTEHTVLDASVGVEAEHGAKKVAIDLCPNELRFVVMDSDLTSLLRFSSGSVGARKQSCLTQDATTRGRGHVDQRFFD